MPEHTYRICTQCIMDTSDPEIDFDRNGVCNHCRRYENVMSPRYHPDKDGGPLLDQLVRRIKTSGKGREYDCIVGLSGGVDSSYTAYLLKKYELRPLAVHFDSGWNSELAVRNIENIVKKLGFDLFTWVCDWEEMKDLQLSFFKASLANCDIPQDHAFVAALYKIAIEKGIKYIVSGHNIASESILPKAWGYTSRDLKHLLAIQKRFGVVKLRHYPGLSFFRSVIYYPIVRHIKIVTPLNFINYVKSDAKKMLIRELDWKDYGGKHCESRFTKFFQSYYLPYKFHYDKRRAHLSSLVVTHQMTREEALAEIKLDLYNRNDIEADKEYIAKKLGVSAGEFDEMIAQPNKSFKDYPHSRVLNFAREIRFKSPKI